MKHVHKVKKIGVVASAFITTEIFNNGFDFIMYPLVIGLLGPVKGGIIMTTLALMLNYGLVVVYRRTQQDWFGFEWLELKKQEEANTFAGKLLRKFLHIGHWPTFIFLCWEDPFKAFVYIRGRKSINSKFSRADWMWFFAANFIGNLIWILLVSGAIEFIKHFVV